MSRFSVPIPTWIVVLGVASAAGLGTFVSCGGVSTEGPPTVGNSRSRLETALSGAIFTTLVDGSTVNSNIYAAKQDVYLDGGPGPRAPAKAAGLPQGDYFFQVTDPSGSDLLSMDHISCRKVHVNESGVVSAVLPGTNYKWTGAWQPVACQHAQGVDKDHSENGAITVQLFPYDDTPNAGGVYKVWMTPVSAYTGNASLVPTNRKDAVNGENYEPGNFHGFVPSSSKTDNFKVRTRKPCDPATITVRKFHDTNTNGTRDDSETEISGWRMTVIDPLGASNDLFTATSVMASPGVWTISEEHPADTAVTASLVDGIPFSTAPSCVDRLRYNGASVTVTVTVQDQCSGETHDILFGNVGLGKIDACKSYDRDGDGIADANEPFVPGWNMALTGTTTSGGAIGPAGLVTGANGCASFKDLFPGTYTLTEEMPATGGWSATGPLSQTFTVSSSLSGSALSGSFSQATFTNLCTGSAAFGTKGYWHNKNGLAEITPADIDVVNHMDPYDGASDYFDAGDEPFDGLLANGTPVPAAMGTMGETLAPAGSPLAEISSFLVDSNATGDPREQLAQQLLAFVLNTRHRLDDPGATVQLADGSYRSAAEIVADAVAAWAGTDADRQHAMQVLLDGFNNNAAVQFVHSTPCTVSFP